VIIPAPSAGVAAFGRKPHFYRRRSAETPQRQKSRIGTDSLAPARSALAGLWLSPNGAPALANGFPCFTIRRFRDKQTFRQWASSLPLSRPHGLCRWQILFAISQMAQIHHGRRVCGDDERHPPRRDAELLFHAVRN